MLRKRFTSALLACMLLLSWSLVPAMAMEVPNNEIVMPRAAGRLDHSLSPGYSRVGEAFSLEAGDKITYDCTYTPKSASMDFGVLGPDGLFYSMNCTSGSIYKAFKVDQTGQYQLAIRNNESYAVTVTGTVKF